MNTISIVVAVVILLVLGFILFTYIYSPDWFVDIAPLPQPLMPSAEIIDEPFVSTPLVDNVFNLRRPTVAK